MLAALNLADELSQSGAAAPAMRATATPAPLTLRNLLDEVLEADANRLVKSARDRIPVEVVRRLCSKIHAQATGVTKKRRVYLPHLPNPHKTCNSSLTSIQSAIETGLQSRWVVNAG